jgi:TPR repeat protein
MPAVGAIVAALVVLGVPLAADAHGRKAVPGDPALLAQYQAGLTAYLNSDYAAALEAWQPIAERKTESSAAQLFLGFIHATGQGSPPDPVAAAEWYGRSANQDNMVAQIRLALMYRRGDGVARDYVRAYLWATLAARWESHVQTVAGALRDALAKEMTPAQIAKAKGLAKAWVEPHGKGE